ncbi:MAG: hypothetical protein OQL08_12275 [Gammaproteobacteria bacterium]|nr:hypothetical protein [Gammaproteobacteria bacterium]
MESLSFRLPEQQPPGEDSFDTSGAAVERWVAELPLGNMGETARRLYQVLYEVNRLELPLGNRFELAERLSAPLHAVLESLGRHYSDLPFPLSGKGLRVAQFANSLLREMVIGYQCVLNSDEDASWFFRMTHRRVWVVSVHRLLHYLNRILCNYRLIHRAVPAGIWLAVHRLYWEAVENHRQHNKLELPLGAGQGTIEREYKQILLLSMLDPRLFSKAQMAQVHANMPLWLERTELIAASERAEGQVGYCVRREADAAHANLTSECCHDCDGERQAGISLDLNGLAGFIAAQLEQARYDAPFRLKGGGEITRETLEILQQSWHTPELQRAARKASDEQAEVAIGMNSLYQLLQEGGDATARGISDQQLSGELRKLSLVEDEAERVLDPGRVMGARPVKDVWQTIFYSTEVNQKSWAREAREKEYCFIPVRQRNHTAAGYGLEFDKGNIESLQVGELLGYRHSAAEPPQLCMVRWLNEDDERLSVGVMRLAASMEPVLVVVHHDERDTALNCLLGIGEDHRPQLFLPHLPGIRDKSLYMVVDGKEVPLTLHDRVVLSPLFDAYHFQVLSAVTDEEMSLPEVNRQLHDLTQGQGVGQGERGVDDFSDLWKTL